MRIAFRSDILSLSSEFSDVLLRKGDFGIGTLGIRYRLSCIDGYCGDTCNQLCSQSKTLSINRIFLLVFRYFINSTTISGLELLEYYFHLGIYMFFNSSTSDHQFYHYCYIM